MLLWQFKKWAWYLLPEIAEYVEESAIAGDSSFKIVCNCYFYNYSIHKKDIVVISKVDVVSLSRNAEIC